MSNKKARFIEIPLIMDSFSSAFDFIEKGLNRNHISKEIISETMLVFEAIFHNLIEQCSDENTLLTIKMQKSFGEIFIKLGFEGKAYVPIEKMQYDISPETKILQAYSDKISYRYGSGYNNIRIVIKRSYRGSMIACIVGILLAILVYLMIDRFMDADTRLNIETKLFIPLIKLFSNAMLMVGAPVTLFSMIKNLTETYIIAERSSSGRKLQIKTIITSCICIVLGLAMGMITALLMTSYAGILEGQVASAGAQSFSETLASLVPSSIFEPFETFMPFPLIMVALLITYAFCSVGEYFDKLKSAIDICYALFSKMLNVVMFALPFFCFLAFLTTLLTRGFGSVLTLLHTLILVLLSLVVIFIFYLIRLLIGGVKVGPFLKGLPPLIRENFKINSAIDAVPYNIRYCVRTYGYNRKRLSEKLPILAQTNLDGNCYIIMLLAVLFVFMLGIEVSWFKIPVIAILILFLSFGAPNQPGSILIGMLIIIFYLQADSLIAVAIYCEVFLGSLQNIINVIGDIVTIAIEEQKS